MQSALILGQFVVLRFIVAPAIAYCVYRNMRDQIYLDSNIGYDSNIGLLHVDPPRGNTQK